MVVLLVVFEAARLALRAMLLVLSAHFLRAAWSSARDVDPVAPKVPDVWPTVTVQLPLRNEFYVVERAILCAVGLDYPQDRLHVQVLDDSDDETTHKARGIVDRLAAEGVSIELLHREKPEGFKAGALNAGLASCESELVAMFDADCVPGADFLKKTVGYFTNPQVGCVQVRWSFLNRSRSILTRLQAIVLDGLFAIDQFARASRGLPMQFNGTNGLWRVKTIREVGGWRGEILAEDADLSFRAHLAGWRLVHLREYSVPTELPEEMATFRTQQTRWSHGSAQLLRSLGWRVLRSDLPFSSKLMMFMHMGRHGIDPLILMASLTSPFTTLYGLAFLVEYTVPVNAALLSLVGLGCIVFYGAALRYVRAPAIDALLIPLVIPLAIGLSLAYSIAFTRGLVSRSATFVRTPKAGSGDDRGPRYRVNKPFAAVVEVAFGSAHVYFAYMAFDVGLWPEGAFFAMLAGSFLWVGLGTLTSRGVGGHA